MKDSSKISAYIRKKRIEVILFSNAKINIGLQIKGKRHDSYHNLESIFYPIPFYDLIEIQEADTDQFSQSGIEINPIDNLITKTVDLLRRDFDFPHIQLHLNKRIPLGSGLGGGSSNATAVLKGLNELFDLDIKTDKMLDYALTLGSDCPFFVENQVAYVSGRGENISPLNFTLKGKYLHLIYPGIHISTADAFSSMDRSISTHLDFTDTSNWQNFKNDFEFGAVESHTNIGILLSHLKKKGAIFASLSGSGSSIYGIYNEKPQLIDGLDNWILEL